MTAMHFEKSETLLLAFRNVRLNEPGTAKEVDYERKRAQQLVLQNMMLRREADAAGDVQLSSLLENLEPILIDIANLPDRPDENSVRTIRQRVERKNIVPLLRVNSTALARALD
jgi:transcription initiation factor TFIIIB Brf1 subunit/transcription initiation factor TFIIB